MRQSGVAWFVAVGLALGAGCTSGSDRKDYVAHDGGDAAPEPAQPDASLLGDAASLTDVALDSDADGVGDFLERAGGDRDGDGDGVPNYLDSDDDGDGIATRDERNRDTDNDGLMDWLDADDDGDGVPTKDELRNVGGSVTRDSDSDGKPDYLDDDRQLESQDGGTVKECAQSETAADLHKKPVDIVFVIDNSTSMDGEILAVQNSVNAAFAKIIGASGIDYRVIMLADFGYAKGTEARSVCISGELSPEQTCPASASSPVYAQAPKQGPRFFHYDPDGATHHRNSSVGSANSLCRALQWLKKPDGWSLAPQGWGKWLRKDAAKVFVEISDDRASCSVDLDGNGVNDVVLDDSKDDPAVSGDIAGEWQANTFDAALRMLDAEQFGSGSQRNYVFHSIIGVPYKMGTPDQPYTPDEAIRGVTESQKCASASNVGRAYEALSRLTGGLRFPICAADAAASSGSLAGFDAIFSKIAQGVIEGSKVSCDFAVPAAPAGQTLNRDTVEVVFTPGSGDAISFREVAGSERCAAANGSFYFDADAIRLCPDTCARVQADMSAKVAVRFGCSLPPRMDPPPLSPPATPE